MAGKHRTDGSDSSKRVAKIAGLAGLAVTASLLSAGTADAAPFGGIFGNPSPNPGTSLHTPGGGFFTAPDPKKPITPGGNFITKTNGTPTSGIGYITAPGPFTVTGFCLNPKGCN